MTGLLLVELNEINFDLVRHILILGGSTSSHEAYATGSARP